eukprot:1161105-Pelagomonas_calceolata.AAC.12
MRRAFTQHQAACAPSCPCKAMHCVTALLTHKDAYAMQCIHAAPSCPCSAMQYTNALPYEQQHDTMTA